MNKIVWPSEHFLKHCTPDEFYAYEADVRARVGSLTRDQDARMSACRRRARNRAAAKNSRDKKNARIQELEARVQELEARLHGCVCGTATPKPVDAADAIHCAYFSAWPWLSEHTPSYAGGVCPPPIMWAQTLNN